MVTPSRYLDSRSTLERSELEVMGIVSHSLNRYLLFTYYTQGTDMEFLLCSLTKQDLFPGGFYFLVGGRKTTEKHDK